MHITHSYLGITRGTFRCLFFLLVEDYIEVQSAFMRELDPALERFARNMKTSGVLVRSFSGDIESTKLHVLEKPWTDAQRGEILNTPGLLMIDVDFDNFDPREHRWLHLSFGSRMHGEAPRADRFAHALGGLAEAVCDAQTDVFVAASALIHEVRFADAAELFTAKSRIFGFSIDLIKGGQLLRELY